MHEAPLPALAERKHLAEQLLGFSPRQEMRLVGRALVGVARRNRHADAEFRREVQEFRDLFGGIVVKDRRVDVDRETLRLRLLDRRNLDVEHTLLAHRLIVALAQAIEMDRKEKIGRRLEEMELLFQKQRVRAQRHKLLALDNALDDLADLPVNEGLAAGDGDERRSALIDRVEAFLDREAPVENGVGIVDLAAARARKIAAEERLQHQNQRIALAPRELLFQEIGRDFRFLEERNHAEFQL